MPNTTRMSVSEFFAECRREQDNHPSWRWGQAVCNTLHRLNPNLANEIHATDLDPYYWSDTKDMSRVVEKIEARWEATYLG